MNYRLELVAHHGVCFIHIIIIIFNVQLKKERNKSLRI